MNYEVWADEDVDYEDNDKFVLQWINDKKYYLKWEEEKEWEK